MGITQQNNKGDNVNQIIDSITVYRESFIPANDGKIEPFPMNETDYWYRHTDKQGRITEYNGKYVVKIEYKDTRAKENLPF